ncbi:putative disease resistance protein [Spatholobus suberectus]|nr:putative disease resistance protein [Spatholobus suberectus]
MKFANQHLSTPNRHDVENYNDYDLQYRSYQAVYVYPGSSVPDWLEYKTTKDYIIIDLSSPHSPLLGFIFGFAFGKYQRNMGRLEVDITISDGAGEGKQESVKMYIHFEGWKIESDHVCVVYDERCSSFLNNRVKDQTRFKMEVTMGVRDYVLPQGYSNGGARFGVSPISTSAYESFIQQMELLDPMSQFH